MQQLLPTLLAAGVGSHQHEQMLIGVLRMLTEQLHEGTHASADDDNVTSEVARHLLTGMLQLTKVAQAASALSHSD